MQQLNTLFYNINIYFLLIMDGLNIAITIITFFKPQKSKKTFWACLAITCFFIACTLYNNHLTEVPNVTGKYYSDACSMLANNELGYEAISNAESYKVIDQSIAPGKIVYKNTYIKLTVSELPPLADADTEQSTETATADQAALLEKLKADGIPFDDLYLTYARRAVDEIDPESGNAVNYYGKALYNLAINEITLQNKDYPLTFTEYEIDLVEYIGETMLVVIFRNIPSGYYDLTSNISGYQLLHTNLELHTDHMQGEINSEDKFWGNRIFLTANDTGTFLPYAIIIQDENGNLLDGLSYYLSYEEPDKRVLGYYTKNGGFLYDLWAPKGESLHLMLNVSDPEKECILKIRFSSEDHHVIIQVNADGSAKQIH